MFPDTLSSGDLDPKPYAPRWSHPSHRHPHPFREPCLPLPLLHSPMFHPVASLPLYLPFSLPLQDKGPSSSLLTFRTKVSSSPSSYCLSFIITGPAPTPPPQCHNLHPGPSQHTSLPLSTPSLWLLIHGLGRLLPSSAPSVKWPEPMELSKSTSLSPSGTSHRLKVLLIFLPVSKTSSSFL